MTQSPEILREENDAAGLDELVRSFPSILEKLRKSYEELEARAARVEGELSRANVELERRIHELDSLRRHLEAMLESLPCGVVERDAAGTIVSVNRAAASILGIPAEALCGRREHPSCQGAEADGEPREQVRPDGSRLVLTCSYSAVEQADGTIDGSVEILDDRTAWTEMTERLHASDKMAALGTMAAGIAHEIRNPLNAVSGFASLLQREPGLGEKTARWCRLIVDGVVEADAIIANMLSFGSPERMKQEAIDPCALLEGAVSWALPDGGPRAQVAVETHCEVEPFMGDRIKIRQAVRNLIANAVDAQPNGARVDVSLAQEGDDIVIRVIDAGPGVGVEERQRVFDPFYTRHAHGTGLGLPLVDAIARLHGGGVHLSPEPSALGGAEFVIRFPFLPATSSEAVSATPGSS